MDGVVVFPFEIKRLSCRTVGDVSGIFQKKGLVTATIGDWLRGSRPPVGLYSAQGRGLRLS